MDDFVDFSDEEGAPPKSPSEKNDSDFVLDEDPELLEEEEEEDSGSDWEQEARSSKKVGRWTLVGEFTHCWTSHF